MEPSRLNSPPDDADDQLTALLRSNTTALSDNGFSTRVLTALPPRRERHWMLTPRFVCTVVIGATSGIGFAWLKGASLTRLADGLSQIGSEISSCGTTLNDPWFILALGLTAVSLLIPYLLRRRKSQSY